MVLEVDDGNGGAARYFIYIKVDARSVPDPEYRLLGSIFRGPDPSLAIFPILAGAAAISMRILMEAADMRHRRK